MAGAQLRKPPLRVHVETSVFGGIFEDEQTEHCARLFRLGAHGHFALMTSEVVEEELMDSPARVQRYFLGIKDDLVYLNLSNEAVQLFLGYRQLGIVPVRFMPDAMHVALATIASCDLVATLNMKHLARRDQIESFNSYNQLRGYNSIDIRPPEFLVYGNE